MTRRARARAALLAGLVLALAGCGEGGNEQSAQPGGSGPAVAVDTVEAESVERREIEFVPGVVRPHRRARLATRHAGSVRRVHVRAGDVLAADAPLVEIDARELQAARSAAKLEMAAARAARATAVRNRDRFRRLHEQRLVARARLEEAELAAEAAEGRLARVRAELEALEVELDYTTLRAPFDGTVAEVIAETGTFAAPGRPLVIFEDRSGLEIDAVIDPATAATIAPDQTLDVLVQGRDEAFPAVVIGVVPALRDSGVGTRLRLRIDEPPAGVVPGMVARVGLSTVREALRIPARALLRRGQLVGVFVVERAAAGVSRARLRWLLLEPERPSEDAVIVMSGLSAGERVVVTGLERLSDGDPIRPSP